MAIDLGNCSKCRFLIDSVFCSKQARNIVNVSEGCNCTLFEMKQPLNEGRITLNEKTN